MIPPTSKRTRFYSPFAALLMLAICFVFGSGEATASCGDYLMPLGTHQAMSFAAEFSEAEQPGTPIVWSWRLQLATERQSAPPCHGPGCRQAPEDTTAMTTLPPLERQSVNFLGLECCDEAPAAAARTRFFSAEPAFVRQFVLDGILRPPRA